MTSITKIEMMNEYKIDFEALTAVAMIEYIEKTHHAYLKLVLPETQKLINGLMENEGDRRSEFYELHRVFNRLKIELEQHIAKEERILFPVIRDYGYHKTKDLYYKVLNVLKGIEMEHHDTSSLMRQIRSITNDYHLPITASNDHVEAYNNLFAIEEDLNQHIFLENDILFKKVQLGVYEEPKMA